MTLNTTSPSELGVVEIDLRLRVDPVLFTLIGDRLHVLLRRRAWEPFKGWWALPGAINPPGEQLKDTMLRELDRLQLGDIWVEQLKTFDRPPHYIDGTLARPGRDPRGRVISVAYFGLVPAADHRFQRGANHGEHTANDNVTWMPVEALPALAFDHEEIVQYALWRLR